MLNILSNNIIEYVLNLYLDYEKDIIKVKQLYLYKFDIKVHINQRKEHWNDGKFQKYCFYLDYNLIKQNSLIGHLFSKNKYKNNKLHGIQKYWPIDDNGKINTTETVYYFSEGVRIC
jgi:hypothetical protein